MPLVGVRGYDTCATAGSFLYSQAAGIKGGDKIGWGFGVDGDNTLFSGAAVRDLGLGTGLGRLVISASSYGCVGEEATPDIGCGGEVAVEL